MAPSQSSWSDDLSEHSSSPPLPRSADRRTELGDPRSRDENGIMVGKEKRCKYACGRVFAMTDLGMDEFGYHVLKLCPKRPVTCEHCGDATLWAEEWESHLETCPVLNYEPPPPGKTCKCGDPFFS